MPRPRLLLITIMGTPDKVPPGIYDDAPDGPDDRAWFRTRLAELGMDSGFDYLEADGCMDEVLPAPALADAVVVGGSWHSVYEDHPWQRRVLDWLRGWRATGRPLFGICGGHQMACAALGGTVERMTGGTHAATDIVEVTSAGLAHPMFSGLPARVNVHLAHDDHVTVLPAGASVLATYRDTVMALDLGGGWWTTQFHPEMSRDCMVRGWNHLEPRHSANYTDRHDGLPIIANVARSWLAGRASDAA